MSEKKFTTKDGHDLIMKTGSLHATPDDDMVKVIDEQLQAMDDNPNMGLKEFCARTAVVAMELYKEDYRNSTHKGAPPKDFGESRRIYTADGMREIKEELDDVEMTGEGLKKYIGGVYKQKTRGGKKKKETRGRKKYTMEEKQSRNATRLVGNAIAKEIIDSHAKHLPSSLPDNISPELHKMSLSNTLTAHMMGLNKAYTYKDFVDRSEQYLMMALEEDRMPTWEEYCLATGWTIRDLNDFVNGNQKAPDEGVTEVLKKMRDIFASYDLNLAIAGKYDKTIYIFRSKNYYGMKDQVDVATTTTDRIEQPTLSKSELAQKYIDSTTMDD